MSVPGKNDSLTSATCWMLRDSISLDAVDVLKQQLELVDDQPFHLRGAHAAVLQKDINPRLVERGKDVHLHPRQCHRARQPEPTTSISVVIGCFMAKKTGFTRAILR